ncbi:DUF3100 domain-containing protein [Salicibibacter cibi]|uniref:DUF3100 domain-containing protein n=1 Tax=Salicibibacter cibi TaxID=2743001 RepID=A0A7T6ZBF6_9BACI|nr:DUF3100 domain-containing protein [Salicibibacter cibi]QQK80331.1 DUF3100 domain-containing protein [Salicibibacter cibi]
MTRNQEPLKFWKDWRLYFLILCIVLVAELVGPIHFSVGPGVISLLPLLIAFAIGFALYFTPVIKEKQSKNSQPLVTLSIGLLVAKIGGTIGPAIDTIMEVGPALLLQEIGNLGTILLAIPIAVLIGVKREAIGMAPGIGREGSVAIITEKYGFDSPETRGVMSMYVFGTIFGAVFFGIFASFLAAFTPFHPLALAMASGVGSTSMMAAASGSLVTAFPAFENDIVALAGASNLLTMITGIFVFTFIALPLTIKLYQLFTKRKSPNANSKMDAGE